MLQKRISLSRIFEIILHLNSVFHRDDTANGHMVTAVTV